MRLPFLVLTPVCVFLGVGVAVWEGHTLCLAQTLLVFLGATSAHISVNALNEYFDFRSGLDLQTEKTPFSGGSGALPAAADKAKYGLWTGLAALGLTVAVGIYFLFLHGWPMLWVGMLGIVLIVAYTPWATRDPVICLLAPGLGFGPAMVLGAHVALTGTYSWPALAAAAVVFFLVSDLLLLNQFPDVEADRAVGRRHFPIVWGRKKSAWLYTVFLWCAYLAVAVSVAFDLFPRTALLSLVTAVLALWTVRGVVQNAEQPEKLLRFMGVNVLIILFTPLILAVALYAA
jgi:1,4-dihydroxy-2-naphthoate octaprenyltransferase